MNLHGYNRNTRPVAGRDCGFTIGASVCAHPRSAHKYDEVDGSDWCDECWASADPKLNEIAYHCFEQGVFSNV